MGLLQPPKRIVPHLHKRKRCPDTLDPIDRGVEQPSSEGTTSRIELVSEICCEKKAEVCQGSSERQVRRGILWPKKGF